MDAEMAWSKRDGVCRLGLEHMHLPAAAPPPKNKHHPCRTESTVSPGSHFKQPVSDSSTLGLSSACTGVPSGGVGAKVSGCTSAVVDTDMDSAKAQEEINCETPVDCLPDGTPTHRLQETVSAMAQLVASTHLVPRSVAIAQSRQQ
jgi:hypothetical protein